MSVLQAFLVIIGLIVVVFVVFCLWKFFSKKKDVYIVDDYIEPSGCPTIKDYDDIGFC